MSFSVYIMCLPLLVLVHSPVNQSTWLMLDIPTRKILGIVCFVRGIHQQYRFIDVIYG